MNYLLEVCGDCNDADYAYSTCVITEKELSTIKEMLRAIKTVREIYKKYNPEAYCSWRDNLPYFGDVLEAICDLHYNKGIEDVDFDNAPEGARECEFGDLVWYEAFSEEYLPHGTSDLDHTPHTIIEVNVYKLASKTPISLL